MKMFWIFFLIPFCIGAPNREECSSMDYIIDKHLTDFSEALQTVLDEKNSFEMLRGEDEDNFMFVQGCETIERDLNVITCQRLRDKNRNVIRQCYEVDLVGTPLSYCIQRKLDVKKVTNRCVKTYLTSKNQSELKLLLETNVKCLVDGINDLCGEESGKVISENLNKIKYLKGVN
uniref:DUF19 domain-containing protein n=1 Tax=Caenorhabditis tropicalis TaxID=1561998 RepID=A0A1I7UWB7_9PELO